MHTGDCMMTDVHNVYLSLKSIITLNITYYCHCFISKLWLNSQWSSQLMKPILLSNYPPLPAHH